jgi:hypothetical protein
MQYFAVRVVGAAALLREVDQYVRSTRNTVVGDVHERGGAIVCFKNPTLTVQPAFCCIQPLASTNLGGNPGGSRPATKIAFNLCINIESIP